MRQPGPYPVFGSNGRVGFHVEPLVNGPGIIIGRKGTVGAVHFSKEPFWPIDTTFYVTEAEHRDLRFTYYLLCSLGLDRMNADSAVPGLNRNAAHARRILVPPLPEQRAIAHILGTLDDKIELNRRMNETLEAMAQALFKSWFVDFDPVVVNAIRAGNPIPEKFAARAAHYRDNPDALGLPEDILRLFPARFVDSELGPIPEGWEVQPFSETVEVIGGGTPKTSVPEYWGGDIPWFSVVDAPTFAEIWVVDTEKKVTQKGVEASSTRVLPVGTTIISARGTVGRLALVGVPMAMNQSCYGLRGKQGAKGYFNYFSTRTLVSVLQQRAHGSVFDTITRDTLAGVAVIVPPNQVVDEFERLAEPLLRRIHKNLLESRALATLRDALLPKLISGEIRVKDVKHMDGCV
jgi:type I restriction enzyme S subunit